MDPTRTHPPADHGAAAHSDRTPDPGRGPLALARVPGHGDGLPAGLSHARLRRPAPTLLAAALAVVYLIVSPPSLDLAAHLLRAQLFRTEGFGLWDNWWYAGHHTLGYSVLFPPLAALLGPQLVGALSAVATAATFEPLVRERFGPQAWLGALWFGAATATDLFTGRLTFAFGLLPAVGCALALQRRRDGLAAGLAVLTALASPVAALFSALAAAADAIARYAERRDWRATLKPLAVAALSLAPVGVLSILFPEGGSEPFTLATLWPIPAVGAVALAVLPRRDLALRAGIALYILGCIAAFELSTPVGSNAARLGPLLAGPLAALLWWPRRRALLALLALPLAYLQWQAPIRDLTTSLGDASTNSSYYQPLLAFLDRQTHAPFRVEIPFTHFHWEAYEVAPRFPLARGWERQLDIRYNHLFYGGKLNAATYYRWLRALSVRFVAVSSGPADYSAHKEIALIARGLPYLRLVMHTPDWSVYAVRNPLPLATGVATVTALGANQVTLTAGSPGSTLVRVRFTPYWALSGAQGCVAPAGEFTRVTLTRAGTARLVIRFSLSRVGARSPRCH
jgi:hypothetical protein